MVFATYYLQQLSNTYFREAKFDMTISTAEWPSKQRRNLIRTALLEKYNETGVRLDILKSGKKYVIHTYHGTICLL